MAPCSYCQGSDGHFWMRKGALVVAQLRAVDHLPAPVLKGSAARGSSVVVVGWDWCQQGSQECWVAFGCGIQRCICSRKDWGETSQAEDRQGGCGTEMLNSSDILGKKGELLTWAAGSTGAPLQCF